MATKSYRLDNHNVEVDTNSGRVALFGNSRMSFTLKEASELLSILSHHLTPSERVLEVPEDIDPLGTRYITHIDEQYDRVVNHAHYLVSHHLLECEQCLLTKTAIEGRDTDSNVYREGVSAIFLCVRKAEGLQPYLTYSPLLITREAIERLVLRELRLGFTFTLED